MLIIPDLAQDQDQPRNLEYSISTFVCYVQRPERRFRWHQPTLLPRWLLNRIRCRTVNNPWVFLEQVLCMSIYVWPLHSGMHITPDQTLGKPDQWQGPGDVYDGLGKRHHSPEPDLEIAGPDKMGTLGTRGAKEFHIAQREEIPVHTTAQRRPTQ
ncbi:hypothetical protein BJV78DRAFT_961121 [Lactifluus subvellereus]|nr:hypothetical protein BJV78DRAFT_961121 [Lactifluus subvellereus]